MPPAGNRPEVVADGGGLLIGVEPVPDEASRIPHAWPASIAGDLTSLSGPPDLWGGVECSVVRLGDCWRDQVCETGHHDRGTDDLDRLAGLGIRTVRYPVVWERIAQGGETGWAWHDRQLEHLQRLGIEIIAGLVHHGSGPPGTDLLDPAFPEKLAAHAAAAAERYPFIKAWVPVNEPLTTARFSCLYGHWHPHASDESSFLRAVVNQCRGALLAMRAIRRKLPQARFVHTEDVGRVFATPEVAGQAEFENERRWLSLDLLCGRLDGGPWHDMLRGHGAPARHLAELATGEAAPDVIGVNHYATSDRFLDHRTGLYAPGLRGGNGRQTYADTEAVRVRLGEGATGWEPRLREVWDRYRRPIAITEAHLGSSDAAESVRWLMEAWTAAVTLRAEGVPIHAVTAWALFGLMDWDTMLRERRGRLEPGAFDARANPPVPTRIAGVIGALGRGAEIVDPCLDAPGWWRREDRYHDGVAA